MKGRVFRFVNDLDIVARVPPEGVRSLPSYKHVGRGGSSGARSGFCRNRCVSVGVARGVAPDEQVDGPRS
jgi:hypothetical protein